MYIGCGGGGRGWATPANQGHSLHAGVFAKQDIFKFSGKITSVSHSAPLCLS